MFTRIWKQLWELPRAVLCSPLNGVGKLLPRDSESVHPRLLYLELDWSNQNNIFYSKSNEGFNFLWKRKHKRRPQLYNNNKNHVFPNLWKYLFLKNNTPFSLEKPCMEESFQECGQRPSSQPSPTVAFRGWNADASLSEAGVFTLSVIGVGSLFRDSVRWGIAFSSTRPAQHGSLKLLLLAGCTTSGSRVVEKPPTGGGEGSWGSSVKFPKAVAVMPEAAPAISCQHQWWTSCRGSCVGDSNSGVLIGLACGSGSRPVSFDSVSKPVPLASSQEWELQISLWIMFFLPKLSELDSVTCKWDPCQVQFERLETLWSSCQEGVHSPLLPWICPITLGCSGGCDLDWV